MFPKIVGFPPKSSILIGFSIINHPFWVYPYFWKHPYGGPKNTYVTGCILVDSEIGGPWFSQPESSTFLVTKLCAMKFLESCLEAAVNVYRYIVTRRISIVAVLRGSGGTIFSCSKVSSHRRLNWWWTPTGSWIYVFCQWFCSKETNSGLAGVNTEYVDTLCFTYPLRATGINFRDVMRMKPMWLAKSMLDVIMWYSDSWTMTGFVKGQGLGKRFFCCEKLLMYLLNTYEGIGSWSYFADTVDGRNPAPVDR